MMDGVIKNLGAVFIALAAIELITRFCPKNKMVRFVRSLAVLYLMLSLLLGLFSLELPSLSTVNTSNDREEELISYVADAQKTAVQQELCSYLMGLLDAAGVDVEKITVSTDIREDGSIELKTVSAIFSYPSEMERAQALLQNVLEDGVRLSLEVKKDGD